MPGAPASSGTTAHDVCLPDLNTRAEGPKDVTIRRRDGFICCPICLPRRRCLPGFYSIVAAMNERARMTRDAHFVGRDRHLCGHGAGRHGRTHRASDQHLAEQFRGLQYDSLSDMPSHSASPRRWIMYQWALAGIRAITRKLSRLNAGISACSSSSNNGAWPVSYRPPVWTKRFFQGNCPARRRPR